MSNGVVHDFCGRTHAKLFHEERSLRKIQPPHGHCQLCKLEGCTKSLYFDAKTGRVHDFCCFSHAKLAIERGEWDDKKKARVGSRNCSLPGCIERVYVDPSTNEEMDFCGRTHARLAATRGLGAIVEPNVERVIKAENSSLFLLMKAHSKYRTVVTQFKQTWPSQKGPTPTVVRVFQIRQHGPSFQAYKDYCQKLGVKPFDKDTDRVFHGTAASKDCKFYSDLKGAPCRQGVCNVCQILTHGFKTEKAGSRTVGGNLFMDLRYGPGLYFSSISGKANDYAEGSEHAFNDRGVTKKRRAVFLCHVCTGKEYRTKAKNIKKGPFPPSGYDSIIGEVGNGLNYPETVVYNDSAAIPGYLIVYDL